MPRKGRSKKKSAAPKPKREYYETQIADLLHQISIENTNKYAIDEKNIALEAAYATAIGDRNDITDFIKRRTVDNDVKTNTLEKKITKLLEEQAFETADFQRQLKEATVKFDSTHTELSSEVKYLTGLYHSAEYANLRQQKDDILGRLDRVEEDLVVSSCSNRTQLCDAERTIIVQAELQKRAIEAKFDDMRDMKTIQGYKNVMLTQHFIRENAALNNEFDRRLFVHRRLCGEHNYAQQNQQKDGYKVVVEEIENLRKLIESRREIIEKVQHQLRKLKRVYYQRKEQNNAAFEATTREKNMLDQCNELQRKIVNLSHSVLRTYVGGQHQTQLFTQQSHEMSRFAHMFVEMHQEISDVVDLESTSNGIDIDARNKLLVDLLSMMKNMECPKLSAIGSSEAVEYFVAETNNKVERSLFVRTNSSQISQSLRHAEIVVHDFSESEHKVSESRLLDVSSGSDLILSEPSSDNIAPSDLDSEEDLGVSSSD